VERALLWAAEWGRIWQTNVTAHCGGMGPC
jgi:hypothetical protein